MNDYTEILNIIRSTRDISLPQFGIAAVADTKTSPNDVVTEVDRAIETYLKEKFAEVDSSIAFAGEEFGGSRDAKRLWLVDPIDGTGYFVRGTPFCTTMVALIENGQVVFGAIYDFVQDDMYYAIRGGGAFKNDAPISVSDRPLNAAYVNYETRKATPEERTCFDSVTAKAAFVQMMCAGYEYILLATGQTEARITHNPFGYDYDYAPGALLVEEAGGVVANIGSREYDFTNTDTISANPVVFKELAEGDDPVFPIG